MAPPLDLRGQRFGRLIARERTIRVTDTGRHRTEYVCVCDCGNESTISSDALRQGLSVSCGCYQRECIADVGHRNATHGHTRGRKPSPEYESWSHIIQRCTNPNNHAFKDYGGRGLPIEPDFRDSYEAFYDYISTHLGPRPSPKHTIDRIENNLGYVRGNLRWATRTEQNNNKRSNHRITWQNRTLTLAEWSRELRISRETLDRRLIRGWSIERTFTTPVNN